MATRTKNSDQGLVVLKFGDDALRMWLPQSRPAEPNAPVPVPPGPKDPSRGPRQTPPIRIRTRPKKTTPGSPPLPPFALVVPVKTKQSAGPMPFEGVVMQPIRPTAIRSRFSLPYEQLLVQSKGDLAQAVGELRSRFAHLRSVDPVLLTVRVAQADRARGIDVKRLQTVISDPRLGLSAVRLVFADPDDD